MTIELPEPDLLITSNGRVLTLPDEVDITYGEHRVYTANIVRELIEAERQRQDAPAKVVLQQMRRIAELEAQLAALQKDLK